MENVTCLKYSELQCLAKKAGIKANVSRKKLVSALVKYYENETDNNQEVIGSEKIQPDSSIIKTQTHTFEKVPSPRQMMASPCVEEAKMSPKIKEILGEMKPEINNEEMKKSILTTIDKKVQGKCEQECDGKTSDSSGKMVSGIPRFAAFLAKKRELQPFTPGSSRKPLTPGKKNWARIHQRNFEKFDSIDVYLKKKKERAEEITSSVKKARNILAEVQASASRLKSHKTPTGENMVQKPRPSNGNKTIPFKPSVLNLSQADFNFGDMKSPGTMIKKSPKSVKPSATSEMTPTSQTFSMHQKLTGTSLARKQMTTPLKFTATFSSALNATQSVKKKNTFDLQASLARPLTWKPHKGKLKTFGERSPYKKPSRGQNIVKSREVRQAVAAKRRADEKHCRQMARRGICP